MKNIKNVIIIALTFGLVFSLLTDCSNYSTTLSTSIDAHTITNNESFTFDKEFIKSRSFAWNEIKPMIIQNLVDSKHALKVKLMDGNAVKELNLMGFNVDKEILKTILFKDPDDKILDSLLRDNFDGLHIIPAVRKCDLNNSKKYRTMVLGAVIGGKLDTKGHGSHEPFIDFFAPCPKSCDIWNDISDQIDHPTTGENIFPNYAQYSEPKCN